MKLTRKTFVLHSLAEIIGEYGTGLSLIIFATFVIEKKVREVIKN